MKILPNIDTLALMRVNEGFWYLLVANDTNVAYRYALTENEAKNLADALNNGVETVFTYNDGNVSCDIALKNKENNSAGLLFSINGAKMSLFRRRLARPIGAFSG